MDYKKSGVNIELADSLINDIKKKVAKTYNDKVIGTLGGFAGLYKISEDRYLASCADGVGTKIMLAEDLSDFSGIGQDLVAMNVNDLICCGATPVFFLDYLGTGKLERKSYLEIIESISSACVQASVALLGGETAEMPGFYPKGRVDISGFAVGSLHPEDLLPRGIKPGDIIIGVASSGFHSNGFSLIRQVISDNKELAQKCLKPTKIFVKIAKDLTNCFGKSIKGFSHITGSGFLNISRLSKDLGF